MDAIWSLPVLSYLFLPGVTTYSTSLNLLFFYMTWTTLVLSQPALRIEVLGTLAIRLLFFIAPSLFFLLFDSLLPSVAVSLKTQGAAALPTRTLDPARRGGDSAARHSRRKPNAWLAPVGLALANLLLGVALQAGVEALCTHVLHVRSALKVTSTLPSPWRMAKDLLRGFVLREVLFRFHLLTYFVFMSIISLEESLTFSGYSTVPSILLGGITRRQDSHLQSGGRGNFAPWGLLDWLHGTSIGADIGDDVRDELDKHDVSERASDAWEGAKAQGRAGLESARKRSTQSPKSSRSSRSSKG
ncbi:MAG: hypothetical protein M1838_003619 [Thelocarpon superellum]|nr:MAG: hypothetical protein M1838_003619 [Thelocarpon superellum]